SSISAPLHGDRWIPVSPLPPICLKFSAMGNAVVSSQGHFVWYELVTTDVAAAAAFYSRVMGWGAWDASAPGRPYVLFGDKTSAISALTPLPDGARQMGVQPTWVGYVGVDDVDATADRVRRLGGAVQVPPTDVADVSRFSVFTDPQSARLALF